MLRIRNAKISPEKVKKWPCTEIGGSAQGQIATNEERKTLRHWKGLAPLVDAD
jgi:hypothetical protein